MALNLGGNQPGASEAKAESEFKKTEAESQFVYYTCSPVDKFSIGTQYQFIKGQLRLPKEEEEEFDANLAKMDSRTKQIVKKIDVSRAEAFVRSLPPQATKNIDSAAGESAQQQTLIGKTPLGSGSDV